MIYSMIVSAAYALVWAAWPQIAEGALILFVALLLVPACWAERKRWRRGS
jgi:hypothetical protein